MGLGTVPVDVFNPGQVFACLGLMELAELLHEDVRAGFDWSEPGEVRFLVQVDGEADPIATALGFLARAEVHALTTESSGLDTAKWKVPSTIVGHDMPFPIPIPASPATLPAVLATNDNRVTLASWGDGNRPGVLTSRLDNVKFWAGSGGYPGVGLLRDALDSVRDRIDESAAAPFSLCAPQSSSFRFDWRRDYIPIDIGFSLNEHGRMQPVGYPLVEILAAIGLNHARPLREVKLRYRYAIAGRADSRTSVSTALLPPSFIRAALGDAELPVPRRCFTMELDWPGQENQARCITTVSEDASS